MQLMAMLNNSLTCFLFYAGWSVVDDLRSRAMKDIPREELWAFLLMVSPLLVAIALHSLWSWKLLDQAGATACVLSYCAGLFIHIFRGSDVVHVTTYHENMGGEEIKTEIWLQDDKTSIAAIRAKLALVNSIAPASRVVLVTLSGGLCPDDDEEDEVSAGRGGEGEGRGGEGDSDSEDATAASTSRKKLQEEEGEREITSSKMNSQPLSLLLKAGAVEHKRAVVFGWKDIRLRIHVRYDDFDGFGTPLTTRTRFSSPNPQAACSSSSKVNTVRSSSSPATIARHTPSPGMTVNSAIKREMASMQSPPSSFHGKERAVGRSRSRSRSPSGERKSEGSSTTWTDSPGMPPDNAQSFTRASAGDNARAGSGKWSQYNDYEGELVPEEHEDIWTECPSPVPSPPVMCEDDTLGTEDHQAFQSIYASRYGTIEEESPEVTPQLTRRKPKPIVHW